MKIKAYDINTEKDITLTATLTTDHPSSSYGQPVMMISEWNNGLMSPHNWILAGCYAIEMTDEEKPAFFKWRENVLLMIQ